MTAVTSSTMSGITGFIRGAGRNVLELPGSVSDGSGWGKWEVSFLRGLLAWSHHFCGYDIRVEWPNTSLLKCLFYEYQTQHLGVGCAVDHKKCFF